MGEMAVRCPYGRCGYAPDDSLPESRLRELMVRHEATHAAYADVLRPIGMSQIAYSMGDGQRWVQPAPHA